MQLAVRARFGLALILASACTTPVTAPQSASPASTATPAAVASAAVMTPFSGTSAPTESPQGWTTDLTALIPGMDRLHPQLDHGVSLGALNAAAADLATSAPTLTDDQLLDGLMRVVAMVSRQGCDAHTGAYVWGDD